MKLLLLWQVFPLLFCNVTFYNKIAKCVFPHQKMRSLSLLLGTGLVICLIGPIECARIVLDPVVKSHGSFSFIHFLPWTYMSGNKGYPHRKRGHLEGEALDDERMWTGQFQARELSFPQLTANTKGPVMWVCQVKPRCQHAWVQPMTHRVEMAQS